ncbi:MAG: thiol peroxidase [Pseudomonadota bacterium]
MAKITLKGNPVNTSGTLPKIGSKAPEFTLTKTDLNELTLKENIGKFIVLNIFPSLDTGTCANSVRRFNEAANKLKNTLILCVSEDLPFAQKRFCGAEKLTNVCPVSAFRSPEFGEDYGLTIVDGPLKGLLSRCVIILDEQGTVIYTQQVPEITEEPNYDSALQALGKTVTI